MMKTIALVIMFIGSGGSVMTLSPVVENCTQEVVLEQLTIAAEHVKTSMGEDVVGVDFKCVEMTPVPVPTGQKV